MEVKCKCGNIIYDRCFPDPFKIYLYDECEMDELYRHNEVIEPFDKKRKGQFIARECPACGRIYLYRDEYENPVAVFKRMREECKSSSGMQKTHTWHPCPNDADYESTLIVLAKSECTVHVVSQVKEEWFVEKPIEIPDYVLEVSAATTESFRKIFHDIEDGEIISFTHELIKKNLATETEELMSVISAWLQEYNWFETFEDPFTVSIAYLLNKDNEIIVSADTNIEYLLRGQNEGTGAEMLMKEIFVLLHSYEIAYGKDCKNAWEKIINYGFKNPEKYAEIIAENWDL